MKEIVPVTEFLSTDIVEISHPSKTYRIDLEKERLNGFTNKLQSVSQAIFLILNTERYMHPIYSWSYGIELQDLFGKPMNYVKAILPGRIRDALLVDDRVKDVQNFHFANQKGELACRFTAITTEGEVESEVAVKI